MTYALKVNKGVDLMVQNGPSLRYGLFLSANLDASVLSFTDDSQFGVTYYGTAEDLNATTDQEKWRIKRVSQISYGTQTEWANGSADYDQIWDDRYDLFPDPPFFNRYSLQFNGVDSFIVYPQISNFQFQRTDPFSISLWLKGINTNQQYLFGYKVNNDNSPGYAITKVNGTTLRWYFRSTANANAVNTTYTASNLSDGNWHHILLVSNGGTVATTTLYFDGVVLTPTTVENALVGVINYANSFMTLGSRNPVNDSFFGNFDEIAVFNVALSSLQVAAIYNSGNPTDLNLSSAFNNLLLWNRFEQPAQFPIENNYSNTGPHTMVGTLVNMLNTDYVQDVP